MGIGVIITLIVNFTLIAILTGSTFLGIGIVYTALSIAVTYFAKDKEYCKLVISKLVRSWDTSMIENKTDENALLLSIAFLVGAIKIGAAIGIIIEVSAILFIALAILIASGFLIEGYESGVTLSGAYYISKIVVKIYQYFNSFTDKVMQLVINIEFGVLKIETK